MFAGCSEMHVHKPLRFTVQDNCEECKTVLKQLSDYLNNNSTVILKILNGLCGTLGDAAQEVCLAMT